MRVGGGQQPVEAPSPAEEDFALPGHRIGRRQAARVPRNDDQADTLRPFKGVLLGALIGTVFWLALAALLWVVLAGR